MFASFLGGGAGAAASLVADSYTDSATNPDDASIDFRINADGTVVVSLGNGAGSDYSWLSAGSASDCEVQAEATAGSFSSGTEGSYLSLSSDREWTVSRASLGSKSCTATFTIRTTAGEVLATAEITLTASVTA